MQKELDALVREVLPLDRGTMTAAEEYQARLAKPPGSLGRLEEISIQLAGITGRVHNALNKKQLLVFAADNGVVAEGVSSAPQSVTKQQTINLMRGKTGAAVLAKHFGCGLTVCDVGVNADIYESAVLNRKIAYGTQNICTGPAMTREQTLQAILTGAEIARTVDADVIGVGEMGIGNTTTSSAVLAVLLGADVEAVTGRGGGITEESFRKKKAVIRTAIEVNRGRPALFGQFQMVAAAALFFGEESILGQLGEAALGVAPVQMQSLRQLRGGAAGVLAHIDDKVHHPEAQAQLLQPLGGVGGKSPVQCQNAGGHRSRFHMIRSFRSQRPEYSMFT